jgi:hypothetical protein
LRDRPNLVGEPKIDDPTPEQWFNTSAFSVNAAGTFGNAGRNIVPADGLSNMDFSILKNFYYRGENGRIQFRTEFFNVLNQVNFNRPNFNAGTAAFGRVTDARDARAVQFALKFYY